MSIEFEFHIIVLEGVDTDQTCKEVSDFNGMDRNFCTGKAESINFNCPVVTGTGETVVDFSKTIYKEAQRLISLVSDIIKISELDEKNTGFEQEPVELFELSKSVTERMKPVAEKRNITLNVLGGTAKVMGVSKILEEMIENLVDNAVKYNKDNGTVDVIITSSDNTCELVVRDTGIGIPQSEQSRVFERFYCVDKSHSKLVGGTGLGLSIVKHGAMFHEAQIKLESTEGKGTSISLIFNKA